MRESICRFVAPNICPASIAERGTCCTPSDVRRIIGGSAYTTVAIAAGTLPIPNNNTMGMRYTVAGTVCMASRTGRKIDSARLFSAVHTPIGTPNKMQIPTETAMSEMVSMLSCHTPTRPGYTTANAAKLAMTHFLRLAIMANTTTGGMNQGSQPINDSVMFNPRSTVQVMGSRKNVNNQC